MSIWRRLVRFNVVGVAGAVVQLTLLAALVHLAGIDYRIATAVALGTTLVHNFAWHAGWTWRDRRLTGAGIVRAFVRFVGGNGAVSIAGTAVLMPLWVAGAGLPPVAANALTIASCGLVNFWLASRLFNEVGTRFSCGFRPDFSRRAALAVEKKRVPTSFYL